MLADVTETTRPVGKTLPMRGVRWWTIGLCFLATAINFVDRGQPQRGRAEDPGRARAAAGRHGPGAGRLLLDLRAHAASSRLPDRPDRRAAHVRLRGRLVVGLHGHHGARAQPRPDRRVAAWRWASARPRPIPPTRRSSRCGFRARARPGGEHLRQRHPGRDRALAADRRRADRELGWRWSLPSPAASGWSGWSCGCGSTATRASRGAPRPRSCATSRRAARATRNRRRAARRCAGSTSSAAGRIKGMMLGFFA